MDFSTFHVIFAFPSSVTQLLEHLHNVACGEDAVIEMKITQYRRCKIEKVTVRLVKRHSSSFLNGSLVYDKKLWWAQVPPSYISRFWKNWSK